VVDLAKAKEVDKTDSSLQNMHKMVNVTSVSILLSQDNDKKIVILESVPLQVHVGVFPRLKNIILPRCPQNGK
jgi:hypothetical protein